MNYQMRKEKEEEEENWLNLTFDILIIPEDLKGPGVAF